MTDKMSRIRCHTQVLSGYNDSLGQHFGSLSLLARIDTVAGP